MTDWKESIKITMATDPRDWSLNASDAWLWGVVLGWGPAVAHVAALHGWTAADVARLNALHDAYRGKQ